MDIRRMLECQKKMADEETLQKNSEMLKNLLKDYEEKMKAQDITPEWLERKYTL